MKTNAYYHILMVNNWQEIVREQLSLIKRSGLYDQLDAIRIGALGPNIEPLEKIIKPYKKCEIVRYSTDVKEYEFYTLKIAHHDAQNEKPFYGLYFHTKGVSFPKITGGKYWRDYMNHYNITEYKEAIKMLRKNFDTCGVKLLTRKDIPAHKLHYSGNFFWFKSSYLKRLRDPDDCDKENRFNAEFWMGEEEPKTACLCDDFVDYNTKGTFKSGTNYVHTLAYNLPSETEKAVKLLYAQNDNFKHFIIDLGFPIENDKLPRSLEKSKERNTAKLKGIAQKYGSTYLKMDNIGVSQNWDQVFKYLDMADDDVLIGADPDEHTQNEGWVNAMADVMRSGYGLASLMMTDHVALLKGKPTTKVDGYKVMKNVQGINWALIGMTGKFLKQMGSVPFPKNAERYGWIESEIMYYLKKLKVDYAVLPDYKVRHTDYAKSPTEFYSNPDGCQLDEPGSSRLLREWKNLIVFDIKKYGQISLDEYLERKKKGEF